MIDVAQRVQPDYAAGRGHLDHGMQRLGCETPAPGILGEHVPGCCAIDCLEREPRSSEESAVLARKRKVRPDRPLAPFLVAECEKRPRLIQRDMHGPGEIFRDVRIAGVATEHRFDVLRPRALEDESRGQDTFESLDRSGSYFKCFPTSFVISNMLTDDLPPKTAFSVVSALIMRLFFLSCSPFFLM